MGTGLRIFLLGQFHVLAGEVPLNFKVPPKTLPLWAYLLLHAERPISRQTLAFVLWPDEPEDAARANLRRHLYHLRRRLPAAAPDRPWLRGDSETLQWNPGSDTWLDVAEFERLSAAPETLEAAVTLYSGDLLEGQYEEWILQHREFLRSLFLSDLNQLVQQQRARRDYARATALAGRLLAHDPLREDTVRLLMALHHESGDRASALKEYTTFLHRLRDELGVDPMPDTVAIYEAILRNRGLPAEAPSTPPPAVTAPPRPLTLPFVGRQREMEQLESWWSHAARGQGSLVLIAGEAGVGKSRLVNEFARLAETQGARVLLGGTSARRRVPYQAVTAALRTALPMLTVLPVEPIWITALAVLIPELGARYDRAGNPLPALPRLAPERERVRLFEAVAVCLGGLAQARPVVVILEDLQSADSATIALLEHLARRAPSQALLIVGTYRQDEAQPAHPLRDLRRRLQRENLLGHLPLGRLSVADVLALLEEVAKGGREPAALAGRLHAASGGNPLYLREMILGPLAQGEQLEDEAGWIAPLEGDATIPGDIRRIIEARLAPLGAETRRLAEVAAVLGSAFNLELVGLVSGWTESHILDALDDLLDRQLVQETVGGGRFDFAFTHDLIHTVIYEAIPPAVRERRHRRAGHALEETEPGDELAAEVARHLDLGGEREHAAGHLLRAARHALTLYADAEALSLLTRALELTTVPRLRFDLLATREDIHHRHGDRAAQRADLAELSGLVSALGDPDLACEFPRRQVRLQQALGERQAEASWLEKLQECAAASGSACRLAEAQYAGAAYLVETGQYDSARDRLQHALASYELAEDVDGQVKCCCLLAEVSIHRSDLAEMESWVQQAGALAQESSSQAAVAEVLRVASSTAFVRRDLAASRSLAEQVLSLCRMMGDREGEADACSRLAAIAGRLFHVEEARQHYARAAALYEQVGKRQGQAAVLLNAGMLAGNLGRYGEAGGMFQQAEDLFQSMDDRRGLAVVTLNLSAIAIYQEQFARAEETALRSLELARQIGNPLVEAAALGNVGEAALKLGALDMAIRHLQDALAVRARLGLPPGDSAGDRALLTVAYLREGRLPEARQQAEALLEVYAQAGESLPHPQQVLWTVAQVYHAAGDVRRSAELLHQAHDLLQDKAAAIPDPESRTAFLGLPFNRDLLATVHDGRWLQPWDDPSRP